MNFLAHALLSGDDENIIVGNFIADHVKGKAIEKYAEEIRLGIALHREIDAFTDAHPVVRRSIVRLRNGHGKYAGVITDMFYDHLLAVNWNRYSGVLLRQFTSGIYKVMMKHFLILPPKTRRILPYMMADDWLAGYASLENLQRALSGMAQRTSFESGMQHAVQSLREDYALFNKDFTEFFSQLQGQTKRWFEHQGLAG